MIYFCVKKEVWFDTYHNKGQLFTCRGCSKIEIISNLVSNSTRCKHASVCTSHDITDLCNECPARFYCYTRAE